MKKVLLIVNPVSGTVKIKSCILNILDILTSNGCIPTVMITQRRGHAFDIVKEHAYNYDQVICSGGDGTLNEVISGIVSSNLSIPLGYIPLGSTNDFANCMKIPLNVMKATESAIKGELIPIDIGKFENNYFSYIASFGAFTAASYSTPQSIKNSLGHLAYVLEGIKDLQKISPIFIKYTVDNQQYSGDYMFGAVMNSTSIGGIVKLDKSLVDLSDGEFEILLVKMPKTLNEINKIIVSIASSNFENNMFDFFKSSKIEFEFEDDMMWSIDGEGIKSDKKVKIQNLSKRILLIK